MAEGQALDQLTQRFPREASCTSGLVPDASARPFLRPRLGAVAFLHRFGSALNRHVHLHACVIDGLVMPGHDGVAFLPAKHVTPADLATLATRVRYRLVRSFLRKRLLDADAAADMLARENSGSSIDASVRITRSGPPSRRRRSAVATSGPTPRRFSLSLRDRAGMRVRGATHSPAPTTRPDARGQAHREDR